MKNKKLRIAAAITVAVLTGVTAAIMAGYSILTIPIPTMAPAGPLPQPVYDGNAHLYQDSRKFTDIPTFTARVNKKDQKILNQHIRNTATLQHWMVIKDNYDYRVRYLMPDYDVKILKEIAERPHHWAKQQHEQPSVHAVQPPPESLMAAEIFIKETDTRRWATGIATGALIAAILATIYALSLSRPARQARQDSH